MLVNFHPKTCLFLNKTPGTHWLFRLQEKWLKEYDITTEYNNTLVNEFRWSPDGVKHFAEWLRQESFNAKYWEITYKCVDDNRAIAYGIKFDPSCPRYLEKVFKNAGPNEL